jgi:quercetin dioxygenase-like cupin family protein
MSYHVVRADEFAAEEVAPYPAGSAGYSRVPLVGRDVGAVHTGFARCELEPGGGVDLHVHSYEESFYVLEGRPQLTIGERSWQLAPQDCGLVPVGVTHGWRGGDDGDARWLEMSAPAPRQSGPPDTFFVGGPPAREAGPLDIRDPRTRTFFRLDHDAMNLDSLKVGAAVEAPTVSASMATALLAYSGIAVKMLVDSRLGAYLHSMFMVEYQPGGVAQPHDHPLEETYYIVSGEVDAMADEERFTLRAGDLFWTGVGCIHAFWNNSDGRVRWLETQAPQLPANHSYRFNRDWDHLRQAIEGGSR